MENYWMKPGWIYLKKDVNTDGTARGYKFGLTKCNNRRSKEYRTENPSIVHIDDYETNDMERAEAALEWETEKAGMLLYPNSTEWIKPECFDEFMVIWNTVKEANKKGAEISEPVEVEVIAEDCNDYSPDTSTAVAIASFIGHVLFYATIAGGVILLFYAAKYIIALIVAAVIAVACLGLLMETGKPKRRRRRAW